MITNSTRHQHPPPHKEESEDVLRCAASDIVKAKCEKSSLFDEQAEARVPKFHPCEIEHGIFLGAGGFCTVTELLDVVLLSNTTDSDDSPSVASAKTKPIKNTGSVLSAENKEIERTSKPRQGENTTLSSLSSMSAGLLLKTSIQDRSFIAKYHQRDGHARYAVKMLSTSTLAGRNSSAKSPASTGGDHKKFIAGVVDLAMEVKYLSVIQHPHIIKMRGISKTHPCSGSFFIILDRLYDTLADRMKGWEKLQKRMSGLGSLRDLNGMKKEQAFCERLVVAFNICSALHFLHQNNIIYRDLKPDNIGFDVRDDVKIFDFGLAAEMHPSLRVEGTNTYKLTAESGSPRYMAPEVALGKPYNHLVDVYSFSLLLWEICNVKTPFANYDFETLHKKVFRGSDRPAINLKWNMPLRTVMKKCWSQNIGHRLDCEEIMNILGEEIVAAHGGDEKILDNLNISSKTEASVIRTRRRSC